MHSRHENVEVVKTVVDQLKNKNVNSINAQSLIDALKQIQLKKDDFNTVNDVETAVHEVISAEKSLQLNAVPDNNLMIKLGLELEKIKAELRLIHIEFLVNQYWFSFNPEHKEAELVCKNFSELLLKTCDEFIKNEFLVGDKVYADFFANFENHLIQHGTKTPVFSDYRKRASMTESTDLLFLTYQASTYFVYKNMVNLFDEMNRKHDNISSKENLRLLSQTLFQYIQATVNTDINAHFSKEKLQTIDEITEWNLQHLQQKFVQPDEKNKLKLAFLDVLNRYFEQTILAISNEYQHELHSSYLQQSKIEEEQELKRIRAIHISVVKPDYDLLEAEAEKAANMHKAKQANIKAKTISEKKPLDEEGFCHILPEHSARRQIAPPRQSVYQSNHSLFSLSRIKNWVSNTVGDALSNAVSEYTNGSYRR